MYFLPLFPTWALWKQIAVDHPDIRSGEKCSNSLRVDCLHILSAIFLSGRCVSSPSFTYSIIYLHQYGFINFYFVLRIRISCHFILLLRLPQRFLWELFQEVCVPLTSPITALEKKTRKSTFLFSGTRRCSRLIL